MAAEIVEKITFSVRATVVRGKSNTGRFTIAVRDGDSVGRHWVLRALQRIESD